VRSFLKSDMMKTLGCIIIVQIVSIAMCEALGRWIGEVLEFGDLLTIRVTQQLP